MNRAYLTIKGLLLKFFPQPILSSIKTQCHLIRVRQKFPALQKSFAGKSDLLVNVGAGNQGKPGWINIDAYQHEGINCLLDCSGKLPFQDQSVKGIYSEHFFEHLRYEDQARHFLSECHRVMRQGAVLRLIVPDVEAYLRAYCSEGWDQMARVRPLNENHMDPWGLSFRTKMEVVNEVFRQRDEHKFAYDFETLQLLLMDAGFQEVSQSQFGRSQDSQLLLDMPSRSCESLYVEAKR